MIAFAIIRFLILGKLFYSFNRSYYQFLMKIYKRIFNLISLVFIILLASIGVGIAGGIPPSMGNRKMQDRSDIKIELFEEKTKEQEMEMLDVNG